MLFYQRLYVCFFIPEHFAPDECHKFLELRSHSTNDKAVEVIDRLAQIYMLESAMEEYQYTQALKTLQQNVSEQEDGEKN